MIVKREDDIFYADSYLHFYDCDLHKRAKLSTIMKYIAEVAGLDYSMKGYGHQYLWDHGMVFLLSRTNIRMDRVPENNETITVSTWEQGKKGSQFIRPFELFDEKGEKIISAVTTWLLVDPLSRKILRPEVFNGFMPTRQDKLPDCDIPGKLHMPEGGCLVGRRVIRYSDLDSNGHVYNAVYGDIACDILPSAVLEKPIRGFQINYQTEAVLGEELELYLAPDPQDSNGYYIEGRNADGGKCFVCKYSI